MRSDLGDEFEVAKVVISDRALIKQVAPVSPGNEQSFVDAPSVGVLRRSPAPQGLSVEQISPRSVRLRRGHGRAGRDARGTGQQQGKDGAMTGESDDAPV
jgi:hypothetical protein